jgi:20S proteasome subunit beta 4
MDCVFGISGKDFVILAADKSVAQSIIKMQDDDEKIVPLGDNQLIAAVAEVSVRKDFSKLVKANTEYYYYRYNTRLITSEVANFTRNLVSDSLRSRNPMQVGSIIAGFDDGVPSLYIIEQLGAIEKVTKAVLGYASHFLYGLMDDCYKKDFSLDDGKDCIKKCIKELKTRFLINIVDFDVFVISRNGVENISSEFQ